MRWCGRLLRPVHGVREPVIVGATDFPAIPADGVTERLHSMVAVASRHRMLGEIINDGDVPDPYRKSSTATDPGRRRCSETR